jgi:hypothetical protein
MIGRVDPFAGSGKLRLRHLDNDASHRLCMPADVLDVLIGHRFRVLTEQFATARDRNRFRLRISMFDVLHGHPCDSLQTFVIRWSALEARRHGVGPPGR